MARNFISIVYSGKHFQDTTADLQSVQILIVQMVGYIVLEAIVEPALHWRTVMWPALAFMCVRLVKQKKRKNKRDSDSEDEVLMTTQMVLGETRINLD